MVSTPDMGLPLIAAQQNQPEVTHNEAVRLIEALLNGVLSAGDTAPPGSPAEGDAYIVGASATGAWAGRDDHIAVYIGAAWLFIPWVDDAGATIAIGARHEGLRVYVRDIDAWMLWTGSAWVLEPVLPVYTVGTLPSAAVPGTMIYVSDETGGAVPAFADGTNFRRVTDRAVVS